MSACMSGTRGSGVLSSTGDMLVRGVGGVCDMCMCLARGGVGGDGGEWMREFGLGFTIPVNSPDISGVSQFGDLNCVPTSRFIPKISRCVAWILVSLEVGRMISQNTAG